MQPASENTLGEWQFKEQIFLGVTGAFVESENPYAVIYRFNSGGVLDIESVIPDLSS